MKSLNFVMKQHKGQVYGKYWTLVKRFRIKMVTQEFPSVFPVPENETAGIPHRVSDGKS